jgi:tetratricopeptide (TPR) repeat protein
VAEKYKYRGKSDLARKHYAYVLQNDPQNAVGFTDDAVLQLGKLEARDKNYGAAIAYFEKLQTDHPASDLFEEASIWIPYTYMRADDTVRALERFEAFKEAFPESEDLEWVEKQIKKLKEKTEN